MTVTLHLAEEEEEAVVDIGESASAVGKHLAPKLRIWKTARKVKVRQEEGSSLGVNFVVHTTFKVMDSCTMLGKFGMDGEVVNIGNRYII